MSAHKIQHNIRLNEEEWEQIDHLYALSMAKADKTITKSAFIRQLLVGTVTRKLKKQ